MDELLDMIATDASATDISDSIKDTLYEKLLREYNLRDQKLLQLCLILQLKIQK